MDLDAIARRFPLVSRSRPPGRSLAARVEELHETTRGLGAAAGHMRMALACEVCNKAALIASDCGARNLAQGLCWRQYELFDQARPLPAEAARLALQPVLNIPRQLIREGDGDTAYQMLDQLYRAARNRTDLTFAGRKVGLRDVTRTPDDHRMICTLLWAALLADGARALALTGRWTAAAEHAAAHRGVGSRVLDGRQVTVLSLVEQGRHERAMALIDASVTAEPWEQAVLRALRVLCQSAAGSRREQDIAEMLARALQLVAQDDRSTVVFRIRAGMTALDLAGNHKSPAEARLATEIIRLAASDAYASREVLAHPLLRRMLTRQVEQDLTAAVKESGLGCGEVPAAVLSSLMRSVEAAESRLRALIGMTKHICTHNYQSGGS